MEVVQLFCGVDSHKDTLAACLVDQTGRPLAEASVPNTPAGYADSLAGSPSTVRSPGWGSKAAPT